MINIPGNVLEERQNYVASSFAAAVEKLLIVGLVG
jgi:hypothetical protein